MRYIQNTKRRGSALLIALIFSFVVMIMLTGLLYAFKIGLLTTKSITKNSNDKVLGESYIANVKDDIDFTKSSEFEIGDSKFEISVDTDDITSFYPKNSNAELYQAQQYESYNAIYKAYNLGTNVNLQESIIYNKVAANIYSGDSSDSEFIPINVPMINASMISDFKSKSYRFNSKDEIEDTQKGFVGFIRKRQKTLEIFTDENKYEIAIPEDIGDDYNVKVGWDLKYGHWEMLLVMYDKDKLFTNYAMLEELFKEDSVEELVDDMNARWVSVGAGKDIKTAKKTSKAKAKKQASKSSSEKVATVKTSDNQFVKDNIIDVQWFFDEGDRAPELVLFRNGTKDTSPDTNTDTNTDSKSKTKSKGSKSKRQKIEVYYSTHESSDAEYVMKLGDKLSVKGDITEENFKAVVIDFANNLDASTVLLFHPHNESKSIMGVTDFNFNKDHKLGKSLDTYIDGESFGTPVVVSKSADVVDIITFEPTILHKFEYVKGMGSFSSQEFGSNGIEKKFEFAKDDDIVSAEPSEEDIPEGFQSLLPKLGYLFAFTSNGVMQLDYDFNIIQEIDGALQNPQLLIDFDAVKLTINKAYLQSDALDAKAQAIRDLQGDEDDPEDENVVDDSKGSAKDSNKSLSMKEKREKSKKDRDKAKADKKNTENDEEEALPEKIYLNSKYLYPLGVVKETII